MPRGEVDKIPVDKTIFMAIVKARGTSLRKLGGFDMPDVSCSDKTLRRALDDGWIRPIYAEQIARELNVDRDFLLGDPGVITKRILDAEDDIKTRYVYSKLNRYPHFSSIERDSLGSWEDKTLRSILTTFGINYDRQYVTMSLDEKYKLQKDIVNALSDVLYKRFPEDAYGNKSRYRHSILLGELECWYEDRLGIWDKKFDVTEYEKQSAKAKDFIAEFRDQKLPDYTNNPRLGL